MQPEPETAVQAATPAQSGEEAAPAVVPKPVVTQAAAEPEPVPTVKIHIEVTPADATVTLDGAQLPKLPFTAELRKDGIAHHILASAPGYESRKIMLPFDSDREVKIELQERVAAPAHPRRGRPAAASASTANEPTAPAQQANTPRNAPREEDEMAPGVDLVPAKPKQRPRPEIDMDDPYVN
jgi:hypothetical protein